MCTAPGRWDSRYSLSSRTSRSWASLDQPLRLLPQYLPGHHPSPLMTRGRGWWPGSAARGAPAPRPWATRRPRSPPRRAASARPGPPRPGVQLLGHRRAVGCLRPRLQQHAAEVTLIGDVGADRGDDGLQNAARRSSTVRAQSASAINRPGRRSPRGRGGAVPGRRSRASGRHAADGSRPSAGSRTGAGRSVGW